MSNLLRHCVAALILVTLANTAHGHGLVPMLLKLEQIDDLHLRVSLKSGVTVEQTPTPLFPETCTPSAPNDQLSTSEQPNAETITIRPSVAETWLRSSFGSSASIFSP